MVVDKNMMFSRGYNCRYCHHGYYAMQHVVDYANEIGRWNITDVQKTDANKDGIWAAIEESDPASLFHFGHGNDCVTTGDSEQPVWVCGDCANLAGRIVYFMSCLTANGLGPSIINDCGGKAYAGFNVSWTWLANDTNGDPYEDPFAYPFFESAMELWIGLLDGLTFGEAIQRSYDKYTEWIEIKQAEGNSNSVKWLVHDRDSLVGLGDLDASLCLCGEYTNRNECVSNGCYWYDNSCNDTLPEIYEDKVDIFINVPDPNIEIQEFTHPTEVLEGLGIEVSYLITNKGGNGLLHGYLVNVTDDTILENSYWEQYVDYNNEFEVIYQTYPLNKPTQFRVEVYLDGST